MSLLPGPVVGIDTTDLGEGWALHPGDVDDRVRAMGPNRLAEFTAGRACARRALTELDIEVEALPIGPGRAPQWPDGVRGSITHTDGYRGAVAARTRDLAGASIGVDAESIGRVTPKLWKRLFVEPERQALRAHTDPDLAATIFFSAKEAFYKAQYPITEAWVGFGDVRVESVAEGQLRLHRFSDLDALAALRWPVEARWYRDESLVLTGLVVEPISER